MKDFNMKKIKFILMILSIPLLVSCIKCFGTCEDYPQESELYFSNAQEYGISLAGMSLSKEPPKDYEFGSLDRFYWVTRQKIKRNGIEMLKGLEREYACERNPSVHGEHFLLFMNSKKEVVLAWDLRDTTQRWADESLWTMDSTTRTVCCDEIQTEYFNTYRFSDEDFQTQK